MKHKAKALTLIGLLGLAVHFTACNDAPSPQATSNSSPAQSASANSLPISLEDQGRAVRAIQEYGGFVGSDYDGVNSPLIVDESIDPDNLQRPILLVSLTGALSTSGKPLKGRRFSGADDVLSYLEYLPEVRCLVLRSRQATDLTMQYVATLDKLEYLRMENAHVTDKGISHLSRLPRLKVLHMNTSHLSDKSLEYLTDLSTLEDLSLRGNRITDDGMSSLSRLPNLRILALGGGYIKITDRGLFHISACPRLTYLSLDVRAITDDGLKHLMRMRGLTTLRLPSTQLTPIEIQALRIALPNCTMDINYRTYKPLPTPTPSNDPIS